MFQRIIKELRKIIVVLTYLDSERDECSRLDLKLGLACFNENRK